MLLFRGLASVHVMLYHYFYHSNNLVYLLPGKDGESQLYSYVNLQGGLEMPLFFLLSGFSLALGYGSKQWSSKLHVRDVKEKTFSLRMAATLETGLPELPQFTTCPK